MSEPVIKNQEFSEPGDNPGDAKDWLTTYLATGQGFANFGGASSKQPSDDFSWFDTFAKLLGCQDGPYALQYREYNIDVVIPGEKRFTIDGVNITKLVPPGSYILVETLTGNDSLGGMWQVDRAVMDGTSSAIYVTDEILLTTPTTAKIIIPPIIYVDVDGYGWKAKVSDFTTYPIPGGVPAGAKAIVTVDRGVVQEILFDGGESAMLDVYEKFSDQMTLAKVIIEDGAIVFESDTIGSGSHIRVDHNDTTMSVEQFEASGRGQFVQLWGSLFADMANAKADELAEVFSSYLQHCRVSNRSSSDGGWIDVRSEHQGDFASLRIYSPKGVIDSNGVWPISARVTGVNDELNVELNGVPIVVTLDDGVEALEDVVTAIKAKLGEYDPTSDAFVVGEQIYISSYGSIAVTGGSANVDIGFVEDVVFYGDTVATDLGFGDQAVSGSDSERFSSFDDLVSILGLFGSDGVADQFDWFGHFSSLESAGALPGIVKNWLVELCEGSISAVSQDERRFTISSSVDKTTAYRRGVKITISDSTGNDGEYTVDQSAFTGSETTVSVTTRPPSDVGDGSITPNAWIVDGDTFEDGWGGAISDGFRSPRLADGRLFGNPISFPVQIQENRNVLWLGPESAEMKSLQIPGGTYSTPEELVAVLNAGLVALSIGDLFSFGHGSDVSDQYYLTFGLKTAVDYDRHSCFFATVEGRLRGKDARPVLGFSGLSPSGAERFIVYPQLLFDAVNGVGPSIKELTDDEAFLVDPYSLIVWRAFADPTLLVEYVLDNDEIAGIFNGSEPAVGNAYVEYFVVDGWGGPKIDVTVTPDYPEGLPVMSALAIFNEEPGPPTVYEDFESGWS